MYFQVKMAIIIVVWECYPVFAVMEFVVRNMAVIVLHARNWTKKKLQEQQRWLKRLCLPRR